MPLLPERPLLISPQLAATLGLEEALLYQLFGDLNSFGRPTFNNGFNWLNVNPSELMALLPFWSENDIRRISNNLRDKGVLLIGSAPFNAAQDFRFAFNEGKQAVPSIRPRAASNRPATRLMTHSWQPAADVVSQLMQYSIPESFIYNQIAEFVTYWAERADPQHSWNAKFLKHTLRLWREEESRTAKRSRETLMTPDWRPSLEAVEILSQQAEINGNFIEDAIPEFILYWQERGTRKSTWNSDFVRHIKMQWARFTATLEHDNEPRLIKKDWLPSEDLFEVLQLANIPRTFAMQQIPEFVLFWRESGQALSSWNTKFLQQVKRQWAKHCAEGDNTNNERRDRTGRSVSTRHRSIVEDLSDRSWAN